MNSTCLPQSAAIQTPRTQRWSRPLLGVLCLRKLNGWSIMTVRLKRITRAIETGNLSKAFSLLYASQPRVDDHLCSRFNLCPSGPSIQSFDYFFTNVSPSWSSHSCRCPPTRNHLPASLTQRTLNPMLYATRQWRKSRAAFAKASSKAPTAVRIPKTVATYFEDL